MKLTESQKLQLFVIASYASKLDRTFTNEEKEHADNLTDEILDQQDEDIDDNEDCVEDDEEHGEKEASLKEVMDNYHDLLERDLRDRMQKYFDGFKKNGN
jgi:hypothetical protein